MFVFVSINHYVMSVFRIQQRLFPLFLLTDYIMVRQEDKTKVRNVKVITSEEQWWVTN